MVELLGERPFGETKGTYKALAMKLMEEAEEKIIKDEKLRGQQGIEDIVPEEKKSKTEKKVQEKD